MEKYLTGTYWLVSHNGRRYITQGEKPFRSAIFGSTLPPWKTRRQKGKLVWLCVDEGDKKRYYGKIDDKLVSTKDFKGIKFPDMKDFDEPIEIEIVESGKVYVYES